MTPEERKVYKRQWWREYTARHREKVRAAQKAYYAANKAKVSAWGKTYRATRLDKLHAAEKAWRTAHPEHKRAYRRAYFVANRDKEIAAAQAYRQSHQDKWREWFKAYYAKNKEALSQKFAAWALANRAHLAAYCRDNAGLINARTARRRATLLQATPAWADFREIEAIYKEAAQRIRDTGIKHEVDHIVPLQGRTVCGLHVAINLRVITKRDNVRKGNRVMPHIGQPLSPSCEQTN